MNKESKKVSMEEFKKMNFQEMREFCRRDENAFLECLMNIYSEWYLGEINYKIGKIHVPEEILLESRAATWDKLCDQIPELHDQKGKFAVEK